MTDHSTVPNPSILRLLLIPWMLAPLGSFLIEPMKSRLSGLTHMDAPESQIIVKLSLGSMAALQATGCCNTTDSERRQLQGHVVQVERDLEGDPEGSFDGQILGVFDGSLDGSLDRFRVPTAHGRY